MNVAFFTYPAAFQNVGGGEVLLLKMKEYLERRGVTVDLFDIWKGRIERYDLLHVFGSVKDCLGLMQVANRRSVKVAITPLLWSDIRRAIFTEGSIKTKGEFVARHLAKVLFPAFPSSRRKMLLSSDLIFPNSEIEKKQIARLFAVPEEKMSVVYNGVDERFLNADAELFRQRFGAKPFVLSVGRIEPRKNQLNLIRAVKRLGGMRLVLIGSPVSEYPEYDVQCRREGEGFTTFVPTIPHDDPLLESAYAACSLFVLQGWFETPGLVALEAALAGATVIVTRGGSTVEYFADMADYLDPASPVQMSELIRRNLDSVSSERKNELKMRILDRYTWDRAAEKTLQAYQTCVTSPTEK